MSLKVNFLNISYYRNIYLCKGMHRNGAQRQVSKLGIRFELSLNDSSSRRTKNVACTDSRNTRNTRNNRNTRNRRRLTTTVPFFIDHFCRLWLSATVCPWFCQQIPRLTSLVVPACKRRNSKSWRCAYIVSWLAFLSLSLSLLHHLMLSIVHISRLLIQ
jgi:hypothetical protein